MAAAFTACKSRGGVKLLESISDENGEIIEKFEYDEQNRIVKIYGFSTQTITYGTDKSVTVEEFFDYGNTGIKKFAVKGNTLTVTSIGTHEYPETFTVNEDGYIVERVADGGSYVYQYQDGNMAVADRYYVTEFASNKSPFFNTTTPKWLLQYLFGYDATDKNNTLEAMFGADDAGGAKIEYEYDSDGFPVKKTYKSFRPDDDEFLKITHYAYIVKTNK
jgi:hypothetical protein